MPYIEFKFPPYSFVQAFEPASALPDCAPAPGVCMPLDQPIYLSAMLHLRGYTPFNPDHDPVIWLSPIPADADCPPNGTPVTATDYPRAIYSIGHGLQSYQDPFGFQSFDRVAYLNRYPAFNFDTLAEPIGYGDCFKWLIVESSSNEGEMSDFGVVMGCSNCFIREPLTDCYNSLVVYRCNEDAHGFAYSPFPAFHNVVQLPLYLKKPQLVSEENSYRKGDGTYLKLYERVDEVLELETDWRPYDFHKKLKVALGSDWLYVFNETVAVQQGMQPLGSLTWPPTFMRYACREAYQIGWQDVPYRNAMGSTKLITSFPIILTNSNCSTNG